MDHRQTARCGHAETPSKRKTRLFILSSFLGWLDVVSRLRPVTHSSSCNSFWRTFRCRLKVEVIKLFELYFKTQSGDFVFPDDFDFVPFWPLKFIIIIIVVISVVVDGCPRDCHSYIANFPMSIQFRLLPCGTNHIIQFSVNTRTMTRTYIFGLFG